jgi:hypothetical protein
MKTYPIIPALTALLLTLAGCTAEYPVDGRIDEGQPVRIAIDTRASHEKDSEISSLRALGYRTSDGTLAFNEVIELNAESQDDHVDVLTGKYTVIFIANESEDDALSDCLMSITESTNNTLNYLKGLSFSREAFATDKDIPMVTVRENVIIRRQAGDNGEDPLRQSEVIDPKSNEGLPLTTPWEIEMERLGVRVDLTLKLYPDQYEAWVTAGRKIYFDNVPAQAFIHPTEPDGRDDNIRGSVNELAGPSPVDEEGRQTVTITRTAILPYLYLSDTNHADKTKGLSIRLDMEGNGRDLAGTLASDPDNYAIPRNTKLKVTATAVGTDLAFEITTVEDWTTEDIEQEL